MYILHIAVFLNKRSLLKCKALVCHFQCRLKSAFKRLETDDEFKVIAITFFFGKQPDEILMERKKQTALDLFPAGLLHFNAITLFLFLRPVFKLYFKISYEAS